MNEDYFNTFYDALPAATDPSGSAEGGGNFWSSIGAGISNVINSPVAASFINYAFQNKASNPTAHNNQAGFANNFNQDGKPQPAMFDYKPTSSGIGIMPVILLIGGFLLYRKFVK